MWLAAIFFGDGHEAPSLVSVFGRWMTPARLAREWSRNPVRWQRHLERVMAELREDLRDDETSPSVPLRLRVRHRRHGANGYFLQARDYHGAGVGAVVEAAHRHGLVVRLAAEPVAVQQGVAPEGGGPLQDWLSAWQNCGVVTRHSTVGGMVAAGGRRGLIRVGTPGEMKSKWM
jgi:hypothetical protein